jgi:alpha-tubulin suppressor-like RCC1 family protein
MSRLLLLSVLLALIGGCGDDDGPSECSSSLMCDLHPFGQCAAAPSGKMYCQYGGEFANGCESGLRWSEQAGDGLANMCVESPDGGVPDAAPDAGEPDAMDMIDAGLGMLTPALSLGASTSCFIDTMGGLRCWGSNASGQLGYGNTDTIGDTEVPSTAGLTNVGGIATGVAAGTSHTCALLEGGSVRCWGAGMKGALGYGNTSTIGDNELPSSAGDVSIGGTAIQVSAGFSHTCAVLTGGAVRCWGDNPFGELGYGNTNDIGDNEAPSTVSAIDVGGAVKQIEAGNNFTCALLESGAVRCWGYAADGALGYGNTSTIGNDEAPSAAGSVNVGGTAVQLSVGDEHVCVVLDTKKVRCWGRGAAGRLGYGAVSNVGDNETPASLGDVNVGGNVLKVGCGAQHTCALLEGGKVRCWGDAESGQLGYGNTNDIGDNEAPATAGDVNVGGTVVDLAVGGFHTCALLDTGNVRCWGSGASGQLGYGNINNIGDNEAPGSAGNVAY